MPSITIAPKPVVWSNDPIWVEIETALVSGGEATEPNLSCYVQLYNALSNKFIAEFNAPYTLFNGKTYFDLSGFDLQEPEAPLDTMIGAPGACALYKITGIYRLRYNDQFGQPAGTPETLIDSANFNMVYGHTPYWYGIGDTAEDVLLHSYFDVEGNYAVKEIRKSQDEYVYLFSQTGAATNYYLEVIYTDGTSYQTINKSFPVEKDYVSVVNMGWDAQDMDSEVDLTKTVQSYIIHVLVNGDEKLIMCALDDHDTEYDEYLLYDNGIGGCEVVRCSGRHKINVETQKTFITRSRARGSNYRDGFDAVHNQSGAEVWEMNTGFYDKVYLRHLSQMFLSKKVWYIDRFRQKFINVTIRDNNKLLVDKDNGLHAFSFSMKFDDRPSIGTLNI